MLDGGAPAALHDRDRETSMRAFTPLALTVAVLALAACSQPAEAPVAPEPAPAAAPTLGGIDLTQPLHIGGNEPFWAIEMTGPEMVYSGVDRPEQRAPQGQPTLQGTMATWESTTGAGQPLRITLTATDCSDGMSDRVWPLTAMVEIAGESLTGCAATASAHRAAGESGRVVDPVQPAG